MQRNDDPENDLARRDRSEFYARVPGHSANFSLNDLLPLYGEGFCFALKDAWRRYARNQPKQSASKIFYALRWSLHILAQLGETNPKTPCGKLYRSLRDDHAERIDRETFESARDAVAERLLAAGEGTAKNRTRASRVHNLNSLLRRFARLGYVPAVDPYRTDHLRLERGAVPSLAQLTRSGGETAPVGVDSVSFNEHAEGMLELNIARLDALRSALASDLLAEYEVFQTGQAWLRREDLPTADE